MATSVAESYLRKFVRLAGTSVAYDQPAKDEFHRMARRILKCVAEKLGLQPGEYDLRTNKAGIAVSGEITLHADWVYIQIAQTCLGADMGFMYRSCRGRRDYTGGHNRWMKWESLLDLDRACVAFGECRREAATA